MNVQLTVTIGTQAYTGTTGEVFYTPVPSRRSVSISTAQVSNAVDSKTVAELRRRLRGYP